MDVLEHRTECLWNAAILQALTFQATGHIILLSSVWAAPYLGHSEYDGPVALRRYLSEKVQFTLSHRITSITSIMVKGKQQLKAQPSRRQTAASKQSGAANSPSAASSSSAREPLPHKPTTSGTVPSCCGCGVVIGEDTKALQCDKCQNDVWKCIFWFSSLVFFVVVPCGRLS